MRERGDKEGVRIYRRKEGGVVGGGAGAGGGAGERERGGGDMPFTCQNNHVCVSMEGGR